MKKLLVLMLVLGMASLANAVIVYNPGWFITVDTVGTIETGVLFSVSVDVGSSALGEISGSGNNAAELTITGGIVSNVVINSSAGWGSPPSTPTATANGNVITLLASVGTTAIAAGTELFTFDITAGGVGTIVIDASDGVWAAFDAVEGEFDGYWNDTTAPDSYAAGTAGYAEVIVTPEPMTMVLLGLGGLFLRRRK